MTVGLGSQSSFHCAFHCRSETLAQQSEQTSKKIWRTCKDSNLGPLPSESICLTDTFQVYESDEDLALYIPDNSGRRPRQKKLDIRVIVGKDK